MRTSLSFCSSTVGKKFMVAVTGVILLGFVIGHLVGNLQIFEGAQKLNEYGAFLKHEKIPLWAIRIVLLASVLIHIVATVQLTARNRASRPVPYAVYEPVQASVPSRFMIWSGVFLGCYIVYHILHLTLGVTHPDFRGENIYANVVIGFSQWPVAVVYMLAMVALGFHLYHGIYSAFQTLGFNHPKYNRLRRCLAVGLGVAIPAGYIAIPAAVLAGVLHL